MRKAQDIVIDINQFEPQNGNWLKLDGLLNELWETGEQENYKADLLRVFERFSEEDGAGVLWSIIHGVESLKIYETDLVESLNRQPSEMGLIMLRRIKNSGSKTVGGMKINKVVDNLLSSGKITPTMRQYLMEIRE